MPSGRSKLSPSMMVGAGNRLKALELRKSGATYEQIGKHLGMSIQGARKHVQNALRDIEKECGELAHEVQRLELERLDVMLLGLWKEARQGNVSAIDRVLKIQERRASLVGLDAPKQTKTEVTVTQRNDLTRLSDDDLRQMEAILERATAIVVDGDTSGESTTKPGHLLTDGVESS